MNAEKVASTMAQDSTLATPDSFLARHGRLLDELFEAAKAPRWSLSKETFAERLRQSAIKHYGAVHSSDAELAVYLKSLHLQDLALACACHEGIEEAWNFFVEHYRHDLRVAARAMLNAQGSRDNSRAEELADSLYADLYGIRPDKDGKRKSLFVYFHGRSKLSTWLRAVLAQRHVDLLRAGSRTIPLSDENDEERVRTPARGADCAPADPDRAKYLCRLDGALSAALTGLSPRERMILACYYVDGLTLAETGRMLHEHESTVSRQLDRIRQTIRESVTDSLRRETAARDGIAAAPALDDAQVELAFEYALEDWPFDLSRALSLRKADLPEK